jgi:hypothetical protein
VLLHLANLATPIRPAGAVALTRPDPFHDVHAARHALSPIGLTVVREQDLVNLEALQRASVSIAEALLTNAPPPQQAIELVNDLASSASAHPSFPGCRVSNHVRTRSGTNRLPRPPSPAG